MPKSPPSVEFPPLKVANSAGARWIEKWPQSGGEKSPEVPKILEDIGWSFPPPPPTQDSSDQYCFSFGIPY